MISLSEELIDRITAVIYYLRIGKPVAPIEIPEDLPDNEIRQLITYVNRFLVEFTAFKYFIFRDNYLPKNIRLKYFSPSRELYTISHYGK